ncbi:saccharopine dehydrogenase [Kitasatospora sp. NPDC096147]|uniref:saccharopine dehydrogenase n=1 Tax=Kitasatospora sp. NPDC096147 TaxID=3364093 RepID=UPI0037FF4E49
MTLDQLSHDPSGPVLLLGGYGTVGAELARAAAPFWPLMLAGRTPSRAAELCRETGAVARRWDLADPEPFAAGVRAVVALVNDPADRALEAALRGGVPYVDVTRWTARLQRAVARVSLENGAGAAAPVLLSSGWMGGVVPLVAAALAERLGGLESLDTAIRYDLADRAGADSVEFMDRLGLAYEVTEGGLSRAVTPLTAARTVDVGGERTRVARIDTPEQFSLPLTLGASSVTTRIGFSSVGATRALIGLGRVGFFRWASGERWQPARRKLLYAPGEGGTARLRLDASGPRGRASWTVTDPAGQAHLTAVGALLGLRRVLGEDGAPAPAGLVFPEQHPRAGEVVGALADLGVAVEATGGAGEVAA